MSASGRLGMHPGHNVVARRCRLKSDVPDEYRPVRVGSPTDSVGEPSARDPQADRAMMPNRDHHGVAGAVVRDSAKRRAPGIEPVGGSKFTDDGRPRTGNWHDLVPLVHTPTFDGVRTHGGQLSTAISPERRQERRQPRQPHGPRSKRQPGGKKYRGGRQRDDDGDQSRAVAATDPAKPSSQSRVVTAQTAFEFGDCPVDLLVVHRGIPDLIGAA